MKKIKNNLKQIIWIKNIKKLKMIQASNLNKKNKFKWKLKKQKIAKMKKY